MESFRTFSLVAASSLNIMSLRFTWSVVCGCPVRSPRHGMPLCEYTAPHPFCHRWALGPIPVWSYEKRAVKTELALRHHVPQPVCVWAAGRVVDMPNIKVAILTISKCTNSRGISYSHTVFKTITTISKMFSLSQTENLTHQAITLHFPSPSPW